MYIFQYSKVLNLKYLNLDILRIDSYSDLGLIHEYDIDLNLNYNCIKF